MILPGDAYVVVVEDNPDNLMVVTDLLRMMGCAT